MQVASEAAGGIQSSYSRLSLFGAIYGAPAALVAAATFAWYRPGTFVAAGDVGLFFTRGLSSNVAHTWGYSITGAGSRVADATRIVEVVVASAIGGLGGSAQIAQQTFFALWLAIAVVAVVYCVRQLVPRAALAASVTALVAVGSPLIFTSRVSPLVLATLASMAAGCGVLVAASRRADLSVIAVTAASLPFVYVVQNPAYALTAALGIACAFGYIWSLEGSDGLRSAVRFALRCAPLFVLMHLWWIVPTAFQYFGNTLRLDAQVDVASWSWTHANASIPRLLTFTSSWAWSSYFSWAAFFERMPISAALWVFPLLVLIGPLVVTSSRRRRVGLMSIAMGVIALWMAKGLHAPLGGTNMWLYRHVPGFWLFREPTNKFGLIALLLFGIGLSVVLQELADWGDGEYRRSALIVTAVLSAALLAPTLPLYTGDVVSGPVGRLPSSRVSVPPAWDQVARRVNEDSRDGKLLVLPSNSFYQMPTTWGYYGVADLPRLLVKRPTLLSLPGSYFGDPGAQTALVSELETRLLTGQVSGMARVLDALGVSHVLVREDFAKSLDSDEPLKVGRLIDALKSTDLFHPLEQFGVATLLTRRSIPRPIEVFGASASVSSSSDSGTARVVSRLPFGTAAISIEGAAERKESPLEVGESDGHDVAVEFTSGVPYVGRVDDIRGQRILELSPAFGLQIGSRRLAPRVIRMDLSRPEEFVGLIVDQEVVQARSEMNLILRPTSKLAPLFTQEAGKALTRWTPTAGCTVGTSFLPRGPKDSTADELRLEAAGEACVMSTTVATGTFSFQFEHRTVSGHSSHVCFWLLEPDRCEASVALPSGDGWSAESFVVRVPSGQTGHLSIYGDALERRHTDKRYRNLTLVPVLQGERWDLDPDTVLTNVVLSRGSTAARTSTSAPIQQEFGRLGNCNVSGGDEGLRLSRLGTDGVQLAARTGSACAALPLRGVASGQSYRLSFDRRTLRGSPARVCVWVDGPDLCVGNDVADASKTFAKAEVEFEVIEAATGVRVFMYADGLRDSETVTQYRGFRVEPVVAYNLVAFDSEDSDRHAGELEMLSSGREGFSFRLRARAKSVVLALRDAADPGWRLSGAPAGVQVTPVVVDGYRQGWRLSSVKPFKGKITFGPASAVGWAQRLSIVTLCLALLVALLRALVMWRSLKTTHGRTSVDSEDS